ncbi:MAG: copper chaperone PCu(A)C [Mesorhizobium sp.]|nr:copper chaperone PCu(A)C [Mesorhizobium sp.]MBL8577293.1 copper chaperone PCu(A)C [Mesorhizobium sp.]
MGAKSLKCAGLLIAGILTWTVPSTAHDHKAGSIEIEHPWSRATPPGAPVAGGYLEIRNVGNEADRLVSASSDLAASTELHESTMQDGMMRMRPMAGPLEIPAGQTVKIGDGNHIMFVKPARSLRKGETFKATLTFEKAGAVDIEFLVQGMGGREAEEALGHGMHGSAAP